MPPPPQATATRATRRSNNPWFYVCLFAAFVFMVYVQFTLFPAEEFEEPSQPVTSENQPPKTPMKTAVPGENYPSDSLRLLAPCVPGGRTRGMTRRAFKQRLLACGSLVYAQEFNNTFVYAYELATLERLSKSQVPKCKMALLYHVSMNPLPMWFPVPSAEELQIRVPLPGLLEMAH